MCPTLSSTRFRRSYTSEQIRARRRDHGAQPEEISIGTPPQDLEMADQARRLIRGDECPAFSTVPGTEERSDPT